MQSFDWPVRVYYEDTDSGGVVYHANYLKFMERARTEWLRQLGFEQNVLKDEHNCLFAVHSMQINFRRPARFNDALLIRSEMTQTSGASMQFEQSVLRDGELLCFFYFDGDAM
jgi:acyl-CoA thioester hydrolase